MYKNAFNRSIYAILLTAITILSLTACKKDKIGAPVITAVHNYEAAPNDTLVQTVYTGQWVVLLGANLDGAGQVLFGGVPATVNNALSTSGSLVIQIPAIPFQSVPADKLNEITVIGEGGMFTFKIGITGPPQISYIRNHAASPRDTIVTALFPGQEVNFLGFNLKNATSIAFQGVEADLSAVVYTDSSVIVKVPADLSGGDATLANTITYTTAIGAGSFPITIIGPPIITSVSLENPMAGDSVYLYGNNFFAVQSISFAGASITSFAESADGSSVGFIVPALTQSAPVSVTTQAGTFATVFNVNDVTTGAISNFEWGGVFRWDWWGGASLESGVAAFPGNNTQYLTLKSNVLNPGGGDEFSTAIRIGGGQWLPKANVGDPVNSWVLKFEMNVPGPWNGSTLSIKSSINDFRARYEPWQVSATTTAPFSSKGWKTVAIPLSSFRRNDPTLGQGKGEQVKSIVELLGAEGKSDLILYLHNYGTSPTTVAFNAAFDNFRVVRR